MALLSLNTNTASYDWRQGSSLVYIMLFIRSVFLSLWRTVNTSASLSVSYSVALPVHFRFVGGGVVRVHFGNKTFLFKARALRSV